MATGIGPIDVGHIIVRATRESSLPNSWERLTEQTLYELGVTEVHRLTWQLYGYTVHIQGYVQCAGCKPRKVELPRGKKCADF